jgi:hypothetical protein
MNSSGFGQGHVADTFEFLGTRVTDGSSKRTRLHEVTSHIHCVTIKFSNLRFYSIKTKDIYR